MDVIIERERRIPVAMKVDVAVAGGGPAGLAAAASAARNGVDTLLVERHGFLGGMATAGLVGPFMTRYAGSEKVIEGVFEEIIKRLNRYGGFMEPGSFDPEILKYVALEMVEESGAKLLLHSLVVSAIVEANRIKGLIMENKSGRQAIMAEVIIDATGDGDVAASAGAPYKKGREENGVMQAMTLFFRMGNVNLEKVVQYVKQHPDQFVLRPTAREFKKSHIFAVAGYSDLVKRGIEKKELFKGMPPFGIFFITMVHKGEVQVNTTRVVNLNGTSTADLTSAEVEARRQVMQIVNFLKENVPGFESSYLTQTATQIGVRESRRIVGEYVFTGEDVAYGRKFEDVVARGSYPIDIHSPNGKEKGFPEMRPGTSYDIPYRCLVPQKIDNLLVAGRCISSTHEGQSAIRIMPICFAMGQAAGTAAALAVKNKVPPRKLDVKLLQSTLIKQGANLGSRRKAA